MEFLRTWIIGISAAALLGVAATAIAPSGGAARIVKLCAALLLAFAIVQPLVGLEPDLSLEGLLPDIPAAKNAGSIAEELTARIIAEESAAYIVSKAQALGLSVEAVVECKMGEYFPEPYAVTLYCERPLHAKNALEDLLSEDLGITAENQWFRETP